MTLWLVLPILLAGIPTTAVDTGIISGVVRMPDGTPAVHARVAAMPVSTEPFGPGNATMLVALGETDDSGRYRLEEVPAGRYQVVAGRVDSPTFYPGVAEIALATVVTVTAGNEVAGIDFTISKESSQKNISPFRINPLLNLQSPSPTQPPLISVIGRITFDPASQGSPMPDLITLSIRSTTARPVIDQLNRSATNTTKVSVPVAPNGTFILSLPAGDTSITGVGLPTGYAVKSMTTGSTNLFSNAFNVQPGIPEILITVSADLRSRYRIDGQLTGAAPGRTFFAEPIELTSESGVVVRILIETGGRFAFTNLLPGNYVLRFASSNGNGEQRVTIVDHHVNVELSVLP